MESSQPPFAMDPLVGVTCWARKVQKPHPTRFTLENWQLLPCLQFLAEWNHLSLWSTKSDGLVYPEAHFLHHFCSRAILYRFGAFSYTGKYGCRAKALTSNDTQKKNMPIWHVWVEGAKFFSTARYLRKASISVRPIPLGWTNPCSILWKNM